MVFKMFVLCNRNESDYCLFGKVELSSFSVIYSEYNQYWFITDGNDRAYEELRIEMRDP